MKRKATHFLFLITAAAIALAATSGAQVTFFGAQKILFYQQTANDKAPKTPYGFSLYAYVTTAVTGDAASFTVSAVDTVNLTSTDGLHFAGSNFYDSLAALNAAFPVGSTYKFAAVGGTLNGDSDNLHIIADAFPPIPYLTGLEFTRLSKLKPDTAVTINLALSGSSASTGVNFAIFSSDGSTLLYVLDAPAGTTSFKIPRKEINALTPGVAYQGQIDTFNLKDVKSTGSFSSAPDYDGFETATSFPFEVE